MVSEMDKDVDFPERCSKCPPWGCRICPVLQLLATERLVIETQARHIENLERLLADARPDSGDMFQLKLNEPPGKKPEATPDGILRLHHLDPMQRFFNYLTVGFTFAAAAYAIYGLVR
jgi:uncharacterized membrane protein YccC